MLGIEEISEGTKMTIFVSRAYNFDIFIYEIKEDDMLTMSMRWIISNILLF